MIQRIQSLYLTLTGIIGIICGLITDFIPNERIDMILLLVVSILAFISIFCFKNRSAQKNINYLNIIINLLLIGFMVYYLLITPGGDLSPKKGVELIVPVLLIILLAMANKYINKDEKLIKSVDRFR